MSLRVALNGRFSGRGRSTGTQRSAFHLFDALVRMPGRDFDLVVFADPEHPGLAPWREFEGVEVVAVPFRRWGRGRAQAWEQLEFPRAALRCGCQVAHHPMTTSPVWRHGLKTVVTLHDLHVWLHPEWFSMAFRAVYAVCAEPGLRRADRVVAVSDHVAAEAMRCWRLPPERVRRVYHGVRGEATGGRAPVPPAAGAILCVGSLQPHKNLAGLVAAFRRLRGTRPGLELWVAGSPQAGFATVAGVGELPTVEGVRLLGYLQDADLDAVYRACTVFCYPSLEEGFGLPVLEALRCGTVVVMSSTSSLPEVGGPAAILVDPRDGRSLTDALERALGMSVEERGRLREVGRRWSGAFTWERAAREYAAIYRELES